MSEKAIYLTVPLNDTLEILRLLDRIARPEVTYCDDLLPMAQQAVRLSRMQANEAIDIIHKWSMIP